jgi:hypothetical protein
MHRVNCVRPRIEDETEDLPCHPFQNTF